MVLDFEPEVVFDANGNKLGVQLTMEQWAKIYPHIRDMIDEKQRQESDEAIQDWQERNV